MKYNRKINEIDMVKIFKNNYDLFKRENCITKNDRKYLEYH